jgi:hypothetical protein
LNEITKTEFVVDSEFEKRNKASFYDSYYIDISTDEYRWRDFGAVEKSQSIVEIGKAAISEWPKLVSHINQIRVKLV